MNEQKRENGGSTGLANALAEAQSIIEAAEKRAADLKIQAEKTYQESRDQGYREGFEKGRTEASIQAVRLIEESTEVADKLAEEAAKLAIAISSTIINEHIKLEPEAVKSIAMAAIRESVIGDTVTLIISTEDEEVINGSLEQLRRIAGGASVSVESDPTLDRGSCIVRTDFGEIDASIEVLVESVRERLGLAENDG